MVRNVFISEEIAIFVNSFLIKRQFGIHLQLKIEENIAINYKNTYRIIKAYANGYSITY